MQCPLCKRRLSFSLLSSIILLASIGNLCDGNSMKQKVKVSMHLLVTSGPKQIKHQIIINSSLPCLLRNLEPFHLTHCEQKFWLNQGGDRTPNCRAKWLQPNPNPLLWSRRNPSWHIRLWELPPGKTGLVNQSETTIAMHYFKGMTCALVLEFAMSEIYLHDWMVMGPSLAPTKQIHADEARLSNLDDSGVDKVDACKR